MVLSARARPKGRRSHSAPQDLDATALRLDSTAMALPERRGRARGSSSAASRRPRAEGFAGATGVHGAAGSGPAV